MEPRIQYAKTEDGVSIAYATEGEGPPLVMLLTPAMAHVRRAWGMYSYSMPGSFRLILNDPRGTGLSDREIDDAVWKSNPTRAGSFVRPPG